MLKECFFQKTINQFIEYELFIFRNCERPFVGCLCRDFGLHIGETD